MVGLLSVGGNDKVIVWKGYVKATSIRTEATVVEGIRPCCCQKDMTIALKSQQPWTAVSALLGLM